MNRRQFFQFSLLSAAASSTLIATLRNGTAWAADKALELIDMSKKKRKDAANETAVKIASGLQYVEDLKAALAAKKTTKTEVKKGAKTYKPEEQTCHNCFFYKETAKDKGTCQLIPGVLVHGPGTCVSWMPKA